MDHKCENIEGLKTKNSMSAGGHSLVAIFKHMAIMFAKSTVIT